MSRFTTRIELHKASSSDYDILSKAMEDEGFEHTIKSGDAIEFILPEGEYIYEGIKSKGEILEKAKKAAVRARKSYSILITEAVGRTWHNLDKIGSWRF